MKRITIYLFFVAVILPIFLTSCASGIQRLRKIDSGMTMADVETIMGRRDSFASAEHKGQLFTLHKYTNRLCNGHVSLNEKCDFYIIFRENAVVETGVSSVRTNPPTMQFLYLFRVS
jgi:hypothetical protein